MCVLPEVLQTSRLILRKPVMADAEMIFASYARDPEVTRFLSWRPHSDVSETRAVVAQYIRRWQTGEGEQAFVIAEDAQPDVALGVIGITISGQAAEIGYVLARRYQNRGYMTEALSCLLDWARAQGAIRRVSALCDVENLASARVLEKAGMMREATLKRHAVHPNISDQPRDCHVFVAVDTIQR